MKTFFFQMQGHNSFCWYTFTGGGGEREREREQAANFLSPDRLKKSAYTQSSNL